MLVLVYITLAKVERRVRDKRGKPLLDPICRCVIDISTCKAGHPPSQYFTKFPFSTLVFLVSQSFQRKDSVQSVFMN